MKELWIYVTKTRKVKKTYEDIKKKYQEGKKGAEGHSSTLIKMQKEMDSLLKEEHEVLEKSFQHITTLDKIALKVDSMFTLKHLDFLIGRMGDEKFAQKVRKLKEMKERMGKKYITQAMNYELANSKKQKRP